MLREVLGFFAIVASAVVLWAGLVLLGGLIAGTVAWAVAGPIFAFYAVEAPSWWLFVLASIAFRAVLGTADSASSGKKV